MIEIINQKLYKLGEQLILHKYPNAAATIVKINASTIEVELSSVDKSCDGKKFRIKPDDIAQHWRRS